MFTKDQILARLRDNKEALRARGVVHAALLDRAPEATQLPAAIPIS